MLRILAPIAIVLAAAGCAASNPYAEHAAGPLNLALGRGYSLDPPPNYATSHVASAVAAGALHDGVLTECDPARHATLAWHMPGGGALRVIFDLADVREIQEVVLHTGAGRFGTPARILVETSTDARRFATVATRNDMRRIDLKSSALYIARFAGAARYVRIVIEPEGDFLVLDEVAVFPRVMTAR